MSRLHGIKNRGFTLVELIVTLVVAAVLGTMLIVFLGTNVMQSGNPIVMSKDYNELNQVMEKIVDEYKGRIANSTLHLDTLKTWIESTYSAYVDQTKTGFVAFDGSNTETSCTYHSVGCYNLKVTLKKGDQGIMGLFTE